MDTFKGVVEIQQKEKCESNIYSPAYLAYIRSAQKVKRLDIIIDQATACEKSCLVTICVFMTH